MMTCGQRNRAPHASLSNRALVHQGWKSVLFCANRACFSSRFVALTKSYYYLFFGGGKKRQKGALEKKLIPNSMQIVVVFFAVSVISLIAYWVTLKAIPAVMPLLFQQNIFGIDINKTTLEQRNKFKQMKKEGTSSDEFKKYVIPESLGIVVGGVYLCAVVFAILVAGVPLDMANAAISSIGFMLLLGFVDDVLDVPWRFKLLLSMIATVPLVLSYNGSVTIAVPIQLRSILGTPSIYLGPLYVLYVGLFCVFCTNGVNILAGVNGVEVAQSIVIAVAAIIHNIIQIMEGYDSTPHLISFVLLAPFVACCCALYLYNRYPSRVFVGDSFTYFAGMTLGVAAIAGGYSKTMMAFFIPQLINFALSLPQLFHLVACPRHRLPVWDPKTDKLNNSRNLTILNAALWILGPLHERTLTQVMVAFQIFCVVLTFVFRYLLAGLVYEVVR